MKNEFKGNKFPGEGCGLDDVFRLGFTLLIFLAAGQIMAADYDDFDSYVKKQMDLHKVPGVSIAIIENHKVSHLLATGLAETNTARVVTNTTPFQVGSVSKPVAAWAFMHLVQEGKLDLDAPVGQYLTRWQLPNSEFDPQEVTLRRLLSHSAGLSLHGYAGFDPDVQRPSVEASLAGETNGSGGVFIQSIPGSKWSYSGGGYTLMQLLVEEVSGLSFSDYVSQHVLAPLQMRNSSYFPTEQQLTATAQAHNFQLGTLPNYRFTAEAAAGLHATAEDLAKFEIANMTTNTVLDDGWVRLMHTAVIQVGSDNMGLGFFLQADDKVVGHGGSNMGWKASIKFVPETGSGVVVLTNSDSGSRLINDVNCYWNEHFDINHLTPMCEKLRAEQAQLNQIITVVSSILALAIATIGFLIYRRRVVFGYQVALSPPLHKRSLVLFFLSIALLVWFLFWHTTVGVYLIAGLPLFRAIDLLPAGSNYISWEVMLLIGLFASLTVIKPQREPSSSGTSANKAENQTDTTPANESMQD